MGAAPVEPRQRDRRHLRPLARRQDRPRSRNSQEHRRLRPGNRAWAWSSATTPSTIASRSRTLPCLPGRSGRGTRTACCKARPITTPTPRPISGTAIGTLATPYPTPIDVERGVTRRILDRAVDAAPRWFWLFEQTPPRSGSQPGMQRTDTAGGILSQSVTLDKSSRLLMNIDQVADERTARGFVGRRRRATAERFRGQPDYHGRLARAGGLCRTEHSRRQEVPGPHSLARGRGKSTVLCPVSGAN